MKTRSGGFTLIELLVVIAIIGVLTALLFPSINSARESARRTQCGSRVRQLAMAALNYESAHRHFPPGIISESQNLRQAKHSGFVFLLPHLEETEVYKAYHLDVAWNDLANEIVHMPLEVFLCPSNISEVPQRAGIRAGASDYAFCKGANSFLCADPKQVKQDSGIYGINTKTKSREIDDGLSHTFALGEAASNANWKARST